MTHSRLPNFSRQVSGGAEETGMKGCADAAASRRSAQRPVLQEFRGVWPHRFIDKTTLIHVGASLNHLGKKCFAFSSLDKSNIPDILAKI